MIFLTKPQNLEEFCVLKKWLVLLTFSLEFLRESSFKIYPKSFVYRKKKSEATQHDCLESFSYKTFVSSFCLLFYIVEL